MIERPPAIVSERYHRWAAAAGVLLIGLGLLAAGVSTAFAEALALTLAVLLMASGLIQVGLALLAANWRPASLHLVAAAADVFIGFLLLANPGEASFTIDALLIVYLFIGGLHRVVQSIWLRPPGWAWLLATGILALILACCLRFGALGLLHIDFWIIGSCVALDFVMHGAGWIIVSRATPRAEAPPAVVETPAAVDPPVHPPAVDLTEPHAYELPFDRSQREMDAEFEQIQKGEQREQARLEKLEQDIQRARRANKDMLSDE